MQRCVARHGRNLLRLSGGIWLIAMAVWFGCAAGTKVLIIKQAEVDLSDVRRLAVLGFEGDYGETVRSLLYSKLAETGQFDLVDAGTAGTPVQAVFDDIDDAGSMAVLDDLVADAVMVARVTSSVRDLRGTEHVRVQVPTGHFKKEKDPSGKWVEVAVMRTVVRPVPYLIRQASLAAHFKVFDLKSRKLLGTGRVVEDRSEKYGLEEGAGRLREGGRSGPEAAAVGRTEVRTAGAAGGVSEQKRILTELSEIVAGRLAAKVSTTTITRTVRFDDGGRQESAGQDLLGQGIEFAKKGQWEEAIGVWQEAIKLEPDNAAAMYNIGVAYETLGGSQNLRLARDMYRKAARLKDDALYTEAAERVRDAMGKHLRHERQKELFKDAPEMRQR